MTCEHFVQHIQTLTFTATVCVSRVCVSVYVYKRPCPSTHPAFLFASTPTRHRQFLFSPLTDQCSQSEHCRLTLLCQSSWVAYTAGVTMDTACFIVAGEKEKKKKSQPISGVSCFIIGSTTKNLSQISIFF